MVESAESTLLYVLPRSCREAAGVNITQELQRRNFLWEPAIVFGHHQTTRGTEFVIHQAQPDDDLDRLARYYELLEESRPIFNRWLADR